MTNLDFENLNWVSHFPKTFSRPLEYGGGLNATYFEVGPGWLPLLYHMFTEIEEELTRSQRSGLMIDQIKEKWGNLCVYVSESTDVIDDIIEKYEDLSSTTCVKCGSDGANKINKGWAIALCPNCQQNYKG